MNWFLFEAPDGTVKQLKSLEAFARRPENHYRPGASPVPGEHEPFVRRVWLRDTANGDDLPIRVVFTFTQSNYLHRHASISLRGRGEPPPPAAVVAICKLLGFDGSMDEWQVVRHPADENVVVVVHPVGVEC